MAPSEAAGETEPLKGWRGAGEESGEDGEDAAGEESFLDIRPAAGPQRRRRRWSAAERSSRSLKLALLLAATAAALAFLALAVPRHWRRGLGQQRRYWHVAASPAVQGLQANDVAVVKNWGVDCWQTCGQKAGFCPGFCGEGSACCRQGFAGDPPECDGVLQWGSQSFHSCSGPVGPKYLLAPSNPAVHRWGGDCLEDCDGAGYCQEVCGMGNACCKFGEALQPPECAGVLEWGAKDRHTCVAPTSPEYAVAAAPEDGSIRNWGQNCWSACGEAGLCQEFCGLGNACCRFRAEHDPPECHGIIAWGSKDRHTCVMPVNPYYQAATASREAAVGNWGEECLASCGGAGYCQEFCGLGNACCRFGDTEPKPECMGVQSWGSKDRFTCVAPVNPAFVAAGPPQGVEVQNWAQNCWEDCGGEAGYCHGFCGAGNACCRFGSPNPPPECQGVWQFGAKDRHTCVAPVNPVWQVKLNSTVQNWGQDCQAACRGVGGACPSFCGLGNACCLFGSASDPPECHGIQEWGAKDRHTCVAPVSAGTYVNHLAEDCWEHCNGAGFCEGWCGEGNACCRFYTKTDPAECKGVTYWPAHGRHTCVRAAPEQPGTPEASVSGACIPGEVQAASGECRNATGPALMTFYVYQATSDAWGSRVGHTNLGNQNFGNVEGVLWRLHKDVVTTCPRRDGINRILRYIVTMRNPDTLFYPPLHYQFGEYTEFQKGQCMFNNSNCELLWRKFGYAVGCTHKSSEAKEDPDFEGAPGPVWYSLPGRCPSEALAAGDQKSVSCSLREPGGECAVPDGSPTCTWKAEYAGEIRIDEVSGISDPAGFCAGGGLEYDPGTDSGTGSSFWNGRRDRALGRHRANFVRELFKMKYPNYPDTLGEPSCDWWR